MLRHADSQRPYRRLGYTYAGPYRDAPGGAMFDLLLLRVHVNSGFRPPALPHKILFLQAGHFGYTVRASACSRRRCSRQGTRRQPPHDLEWKTTPNGAFVLHSGTPALVLR